MQNEYEGQSEIIAALTEEVKENRRHLMSKDKSNDNDSQDITEETAFDNGRKPHAV